ncbi:helix-turn-helix domain-containing protein [Arthrobacter castelli]|uniref:helix-turn-helix domain-containing protein n=1 Tax=Arthrobacter castelli TaxID=271431 RepID=UPI000413D3F3|nr:transcriptional regulator [Arthrobacter castelli]
MSNHQEPESVADLIRQVIERRQLSQKQLAAELDRSPRLIRKILSGTMKGENTRPALTSLRDTGTVESLPPRRRSKAGQVISVRGKATDGEPTLRVPEDPGGPKKRPGRYRHTTHYAENGDFMSQVGMHHKNPQSRQRANESLKADLLHVARGQARNDKRVSWHLQLDDGTTATLGGKNGYFISDVTRRIRDEFGGDANAFIRDQLSKTKYEKAGVSITNISTTAANARGQADRSKKRR